MKTEFIGNESQWIRRGLIADAVKFPFGRFLISYGTAELSRKMGVSRGLAWRWACRRQMPSLPQALEIIAIALAVGVQLTLEQVRPPELAFTSRPSRNTNSGVGAVASDNAGGAL